MKAVRIHQFGPSEEVLQYEEAPTPAPGPGEVLVKMEAAGLNRADLGLRQGGGRYGPGDLPLIPGMELAGSVATVGAGVSGIWVGERVAAYPGIGGYAESAVAKAVQVRPLPDGVDFATAASMPVVFLTAWCALVEEMGMKAGDRVLVQAGGSGVGVAAIQICKHVGARVIITAGSDEKCRRCHDLGADETINYTTRDFVQEVMRLTGGRGVDIVLEMVGGDVYQKSLSVLAPGGRLVSIGRAGGPVPEPPPPPPEGRSATRFSITSYLAAHPEAHQHLDTFFGLIKDKKFRVVVDRTFPLAEARAAQRYLQGREHFGKIVLVP